MVGMVMTVPASESYRTGGTVFFLPITRNLRLGRSHLDCLCSGEIGRRSGRAVSRLSRGQIRPPSGGVVWRRYVRSRVPLDLVVPNLRCVHARISERIIVGIQRRVAPRRLDVGEFLVPPSAWADDGSHCHRSVAGRGGDYDPGRVFHISVELEGRGHHMRNGSAGYVDSTVVFPVHLYHTEDGAGRNC